MAGLTLGQRINAIRGKDSRKVFADKAGVGTATLQRYESDERSPDISFLIKLQEMTGYSLDYLVHGRDASVSNEKALIMEKYDQADSNTQNQVLMLLLGAGNNVKQDVTEGSMGSVSGGTATINNAPNSTTDNHGYINQGRHKGGVKFGK